MLIAWRQRQLDRMVAARLVLSGLIIVHHQNELIEKTAALAGSAGLRGRHVRIENRIASRTSQSNAAELAVLLFEEGDECSICCRVMG